MTMAVRCHLRLAVGIFFDICPLLFTTQVVKGLSGMQYLKRKEFRRRRTIGKVEFRVLELDCKW